jgi:HSP20 family protein
MANTTPKTVTKAKTKSNKKSNKKSSKKVKSSTAKALSPFEQMEHDFEMLLHHRGLFPLRGRTAFSEKMPSVDMIDQKDNILIKAELPGVDKKDLDISVTDKTVTIKGKTSSDKKEEKGNYFRREISSGSYERVMTIPSNIDSSKARAKFRDGLLELTLPKIEKSKGKKVSVE